MALVDMDAGAMNYSDPALPTPAGQMQNLVNAVAPGKTGFTVSAAVCLGVSSVLVLLRLYTKARVLKEFLLEDCKLFGVIIEASTDIL